MLLFNGIYSSGSQWTSSQHICSLGSCNIQFALQLFERFRQGQKPPASLGPSRDYNVDMVPKFIMNSGELVSFLCSTQSWLCCDSIIHCHLTLESTETTLR